MPGTLFSSRRFNAGTYNSPAAGIAVPVGMASITVTVSRVGWSSLPADQQVIALTVERSFDGGATWEFGGGFTAKGGPTIARGGGIIDDSVATSSATFTFRDVTNANRRVRASMTLSARVEIGATLDWAEGPERPRPFHGSAGIGQSETARARNAASCTTAAVTTTAGSAIILLARYGNGDATDYHSSVSDSKTVDWSTQIGTTWDMHGGGGAYGFGRVYANYGGTRGASHTFTHTMSDNSYSSFFMVELTGCAAAPLDQQDRGIDESEPFASPTVNTTQANEMLIGFNSSGGSSAMTFTYNDSFQELDVQGDGSNDWIASTSYRYVTSQAGYATNFELSGTPTHGFPWILTFKEAAGGPTVKGGSDQTVVQSAESARSGLTSTAIDTSLPALVENRQPTLASTSLDGVTPVLGEASDIDIPTANLDPLVPVLAEFTVSEVRLSASDTLIPVLADGGLSAGTVESTDAITVVIKDGSSNEGTGLAQDEVVPALVEAATAAVTLDSFDSPVVIIAEVGSVSTGGAVTPVEASDILILRGEGLGGAPTNVVATPETVEPRLDESTAIAISMDADDPLAFAAVETTSIATSGVAADDLILTLAEFIVSAITATAADTVSQFIVETATIYASLASKDALAILIADSEISDIFSTAADEFSLYLDEPSSRVETPAAAQDALVPVLSEAIGSAISSALSDTVILPVSEAGTVDGSADSADSLAVRLAESGVADLASTGEDVLQPAFVDTAAVAKPGALVDKAAADALAVTITEEQSIAGTGVFVADDQVVAVLDEENASSIALPRSDLLAIGSVETASIAGTLATEDLSPVSIAESHVSIVGVSSDDPLAVRLAETGLFAIEAAAADTVVLAIDGAERSVLVSLVGHDALIPVIVESPSASGVAASDDPLAVSITEGPAIEVSLDSDDTWLPVLAESGATAEPVAASDENVPVLEESGLAVAVVPPSPPVVPHLGAGAGYIPLERAPLRISWIITRHITADDAIRLRVKDNATVWTGELPPAIEPLPQPAQPISVKVVVTPRLRPVKRPVKVPVPAKVREPWRATRLIEASDRCRVLARDQRRTVGYDDALYSVIAQDACLPMAKEGRREVERDDAPWLGEVSYSQRFKEDDELLEELSHVR